MWANFNTKRLLLKLERTDFRLGRANLGPDRDDSNLRDVMTSIGLRWRGLICRQ